jgi:hypothetical protein
MSKQTVLPSEYVTTEKAMKQLGKSERSLQRLVASGDLRFITEDGTRTRFYHAGDLERILEEGTKTQREQPTGRLPRSLPAGGGLVRQSPARLALMLEPRLAKLYAAAHVVEPIPLWRKLWLTLDEAQVYSGLSHGDLVQLCREQRLTARKSPGWRIRRDSLEQFDG